MTYRELIEYCYKSKMKSCEACLYDEECDNFTRVCGILPCRYYDVIQLDIDAEIEVEE